MFAKFFRRAERPPPPGGLIYAIGDIHGRADLLRRLFHSLKKDAEGRDAEFILLGDYVDRGPNSPDVLEFLLELERSREIKATFLKGNHEATFLDFLTDASIGPAWIQYGGTETLASYGVRPPGRNADAEEWEDCRRAFAENVPQSHIDLLKNLDLTAERGCYFFVHAGVNPSRPIHEQAEQDLLWIRDEFTEASRPLERIIVHGHTAIETPHMDKRRIGIDTGAYITGQLTAVRLEGGEACFFTT